MPPPITVEKQSMDLRALPPPDNGRLFPPEILTDIFHQLEPTYPSQGLPLRVCCHWRDVAFADPLLWTEIFIRSLTDARRVNADSLATWMTRSKGYSLSLHLRFEPRHPFIAIDPPFPLNDVLKLLLSQAHRWHQLHIYAEESVLKRVVRVLPDCMQLIYLYISVCDAAGLIPFHAPLHSWDPEHLPPPICLPQLEHLCLTGISHIVSLPTLRMPLLDNLFMSIPPSLSQELVDISLNFKNLKHLHLRYCITAYEKWTKPEGLLFPSLSSLILYDPNHSADPEVFNIWKSIVTASPSLRYLKMAVVMQNRLMELPAMATTITNLCVTLQQSPISSGGRHLTINLQNAISWLSPLENLTTLKLVWKAARATTELPFNPFILALRQNERPIICPRLSSLKLQRASVERVDIFNLLHLRNQWNPPFTSI